MLGKRISENNNYIAVIDTETNYDDKVMSIGVAIGDSSDYALKDKLYVLITPEYLRPAKYTDELYNSRSRGDGIVTRRKAIELVKEILDRYGVTDIFAYNACFDRSHLMELRQYRWFDIMKLAANRNYNRSIPWDTPCYSSGKMKTGYSAERILRMLSDDYYHEIHNAVTDAEDELKIMRLLDLDISAYSVAEIGKAGSHL